MCTLPLTLSISMSSSAVRSLPASMPPALVMPASNTFMHCHCSPSKVSGTVPCSFFHRADAGEIDDLGQQLDLLGQAVLPCLGQERIVVVALQDQEDGVGAGLA